VRVAVIGATGPVGAAVVEALRFDPHKRVNAVVGIAHRLPVDPQPDVEWHAADLVTGDLARHLRGVDALVNAARARSTMPPGGTARDDVALARRVLHTAAAADVHHVVQLSSFLAYSPPSAADEAVDEAWPTAGLTPSPVARSAADLERLLDRFGAEHEVIRLVRFRSGIALGPRVRQRLLAGTGAFVGLLRLLERVPVVPGLERAAVPVVHHDDLAAAVRTAVTQPALGAYNVALDAPLRLSDVASALGARPITMPEGLVRRGAAFADRLLERVPRHGERSASAWLDILAHAPRLDTRKARDELAWAPRHSLDQSLRSTIVTA
jgi:UDP-glucose 4-epimerase